jgi:hypothetical protein
MLYPSGAAHRKRNGRWVNQRERYAAVWGLLAEAFLDLAQRFAFDLADTFAR